jgi:hypothetical protein
MADAPKPPDATRLLHELQQSDELRHQVAVGTELDPHLTLLRAWQSERLAQTYADLLADRQFRSAYLFFLSDIYAPRDFSQRDYDFQRIHNFLSPVVPPQMLQVLTDAIELNSLTNDLDNQLVQILVDKLGMTDTISPRLYVEGYRQCDNHAQRVHQINLITKLVGQVSEGAHLFVANLALRVMRGPAKRAGWNEVYDFLERGYKAFKQMRDVKKFARIIEEREKRILDAIFSGHPDPFAV